jgi:hypothetical protein
MKSCEYRCLGFCEYKQKTINSERTRIVNESNIQQSNHDANLVKKRSDVRKEMKLKDMERVIPTDESMSKAKVIKKIIDKEPITFFSGKDTTDIGKHLKNDGCVLSAVSDCIILDDEKSDFNGIIGFDEKDNVVFIKIPRKHAINHDNTPIVSKYVGCLKRLLKKGKSKGRGAKRPVRSECYTYDGYAGSYTKKGITEPKHFDEDTQKLMNRVGSITEEFLPANFYRGYTRACEKVTHLTQFVTGLYPAIATGINAYLGQHVDEDSFWSTTFIHCDHERMLEKNNKYKMNVKVACYFVFGKLGYAVALRPGDILIFHPCYTHSNSSRTEYFEDKNIDIYCSSLYLKTRVVGGNNADGIVEFINNKRVKVD